MAKVSYGKWAIWMEITVLLSLLADNVIAQPGFLSVDCAGKENHTDENNIAWVTDANYIDVGETAVTGNATLPSYLQTLRFFPKPLNKSCYRFPVFRNVPYRLRLWFALGNYSRFSGSYPNFSHTIETSGMLIDTPFPNYISDPYVHEGIYVSSGELLYVCLIRESETDDPFINSIELRALQNGMYSQAKSGTMLFKQETVDVGGNSIVRYPLDKFDRIWNPYMDPTYSSVVRNVSSKETIFSDSTKNHPPTAVMQTAWVMNTDFSHFPVPTAPWAKSLLLLYLAELEMLNTSEPRSFYVTIDGEELFETISLVRNYSASELAFISNETNEYIFRLLKAPNSSNGPIINAFEYYTIHQTNSDGTNSQDIVAVDAIKSKYGIKGWISDPCYYIPWNGLGCDTSSPAVRISEINLSGRNLTGSVAEEIGHLTALVNVSLENNHLIGPLPNLSGLTMLERLHLQNNSLNGSLPVWLFKLNNLKELFIQNNNFSGLIPVQLVDKSSLNVNFSGNNNLCMYKEGECVQEIRETGNNSKRVSLGNNSKRVSLGITISGCLVIAFALMAGIAVYRRKSRERQRDNEDDTIKVPQLEKYPCFTVKDMTEATEDFSQEIGQGNSGKVFLGKLREGKVVAVKTFSSFPQFQNEADVLSRAEHKNLMPLHGYCNGSKYLMLIYEHMSGGSLSDKLHTGHSNLDWKTRLKIALDVAQGLEFLHAGCTPKIIHRDVKTANILLDNNMNAKLADFGISRIARDGESSHATTSMAKGTPGYIDPEYRRTNKVTEKSDVYSFGVVLFEMICGRKAANGSQDDEEFNLIDWVTPYVKVEKIGAEIIDERLAPNYNLESIDRVAKLALRCVDGTPSLRPSMSDVVGEIKEATILEDNNKELSIQTTRNNNAQLPDLVGNGSQAGPVRSQQDSGKSKDMEWVDDSSEVRPLTL